MSLGSRVTSEIWETSWGGYYASTAAMSINGPMHLGLALFISEQTVKNHLHNIFDKQGVSDRLELALYAIHHRLVEHELPTF